MDAPWSWQPAKGVFLTYQLLSTLFVRVPFWTLSALPRSNRPLASWSIRRVLVLRLLRHYMYLGTKVGSLRKIPNHLAITPGVGIEGVWIPPASNNLIIGELRTFAETSEVKPCRIPGYWIHKKGSSTVWGAPPVEGEKVLLFFHGGAYIRMSGHPSDPTGAVSRGLLKAIPAVKRVFSVEYRLTKAGENPFPAALLDAIAAYDYLVKVVGYLAENIVIAGDSAGGNLSLALTRYLVDYKGQEDVPAPPAALLLLSPWSDIGASQQGRGAAVANVKTDYIAYGKGTVYIQKIFCGNLGVDAAETNRWISPSSVDSRMVVDFKGFPRTYIVCGGAEVLADIIRTLRDKMVEDMGDGVGYHEAPGAFHDYLCFSDEPERSDTLAAIAEWLSADDGW